jgi:16S rRNA (guanine527-N7)-methyltransferase
VAGNVVAATRELVVRYGLPVGSAGQLTALLQLVATDPQAPTTVRDRRAIVDDHLADSLVALDLGQVRAATAIADVGSGAGFPGLPLAIALPAARTTLIESSSRKCAFLERAIAASGVSNATVLHARAEDVGREPPAYDLVTARALAPLPVVAEYAAPLLRLGGTLVAWRGRRDPEDEQAAKLAADELGLEVLEPVHVQPYSRAEHRNLHLMSKVMETAQRFPRRPGVARKRPLGGAPSDRARR